MYVSCQTLLNNYYSIHAYSLNSVYAITHWIYEMILIIFIWLMNIAEYCACMSLTKYFDVVNILSCHIEWFHFCWEVIMNVHAYHWIVFTCSPCCGSMLVFAYNALWHIITKRWLCSWSTLNSECTLCWWCEAWYMYFVSWMCDRELLGYIFVTYKN